MDGTRFDTLTRSFVAVGSRRHALAAALAGALGLAGLVDPDDVTAGGCKPKCPECKKCKCKKTKHGKKCKCKPKPNATVCSVGTCQGGTCVCTPSCGSRNCGDNGCGGSCGTCASGRNCVSGTCTCANRTCAAGTCAVNHETCCAEDNTFNTCTGGQGNCYCVTTTEGTKRCHFGGQPSCTQFGGPCVSSATCPSGTFCSNAPGVCQGNCVRGCPIPAAAMTMEVADAEATGEGSPVR